MFSALVSTHWNPNNSSEFSDTCYSSWNQRNDISKNAIINGAESIAGGERKVKNVNNGYYCFKSDEQSYISHANRDGWIQIDLQKPYPLKCLRVGSGDSFHNIEFRFGNYSRNEEKSIRMNDVIGFTSKGWGRKIAEFCPGYSMIGRFIQIESKKPNPKVTQQVHIGEIQVLVD